MSRSIRPLVSFTAWGLVLVLPFCGPIASRARADKIDSKAITKLLETDTAQAWQVFLAQYRPAKREADFAKLKSVLPDRLVLVPEEPAFAAAVQEMVLAGSQKGSAPISEKVKKILVVSYSLKYGSSLWRRSGSGGVIYGRPSNEPDEFKVDIQLRTYLLDLGEGVLVGFPEGTAETDTVDCDSAIKGLLSKIAPEAGTGHSRLTEMLAEAGTGIVRVAQLIDGDKGQADQGLRRRVACLQIKQDDWRLRQRAVEVLASSNPVENLDALTPVVSESATYVRCALAARLRSKTVPETAVQLLPLLQLLTLDEDDYVRRNAVSALGQTKLPEALGALMAAHRDPHAVVRQAVASALGTLGQQPGIPVLIEMLDDEDDSVGTTAHGALAKLGWQPTTLAEKVKFHLCDDDGTDALVSLSESAVPLLISQLASKNRKRAARSIRVLAKIPDPRATKPLLGCLQDSELAISVAAIEALTERGDKEAIAPIAQILEESGVAAKRLAAIGALARFGTEARGAFDVLTKSLRSAQQDECIAAAEALARMSHPRGEDVLRQALKERSKQDKVAAALVAALSQLGKQAPADLQRLIGALSSQTGDDALKVLLTLDLKGMDPAPVYALFDHKDATVRKRAAKVVGKLATPEAVNRLWKALAAEEDQEVRTTIQTAIRAAVLKR